MRAAVYAGRDWHTDQGPHAFDFTLCVAAHFEEPVLRTAARQQMQPPVVFDRYEGMNRPPGVTAPRAPSGWARWNEPWPTGEWATF